MANQILLPAFYLPPISYFHTILHADAGLLLEQHEHFPKQTYRTRAKIASANGTLDLIVPIRHGHKEHVPMKDVRINYDHNWQRLHWLSLQTAYRSSPYFEYYEDDFAPFYEKKTEFLLDFTIEQLKLLLKLLKIKKEISLTESYTAEIVLEVDYRKIINPKAPSLLQNQKQYYQVFEDKNGFHQDLSIVDLLFNQGPQAKSFL